MSAKRIETFSYLWMYIFLNCEGMNSPCDLSSSKAMSFMSCWATNEGRTDNKSFSCMRGSEISSNQKRNVKFCMSSNRRNNFFLGFSWLKRDLKLTMNSIEKYCGLVYPSPACLSLILLLRPKPGLEGAPGLEEGLPLGALSQVLGVGAAPVDRKVEDKQRRHRVQRLCKQHDVIVYLYHRSYVNLNSAILSSPPSNYFICALDRGNINHVFWGW